MILIYAHSLLVKQRHCHSAATLGIPTSAAAQSTGCQLALLLTPDVSRQQTSNVNVYTMTAVNPLVTLAPAAVSPVQAAAVSEDHLISLHLQLVCHLLQQRAVQLQTDNDSRDSSTSDSSQRQLFVQLYEDGEPAAELPAVTLSHTQYAARLAVLQTLQQYAEQQKYPTVRLADVEELGAHDADNCSRLPVFIDRVSSVHCAVGHMVAATGHTQLAADIDKVAHTSYIHQMLELHKQLAQLPQQELTTTQRQQLAVLHAFEQWRRSVGLTVNELEWIQPQYLHRWKNGTEYWGTMEGHYVPEYNDWYQERLANRPAPPTVVEPTAAHTVYTYAVAAYLPAIAFAVLVSLQIGLDRLSARQSHRVMQYHYIVSMLLVIYLSSFVGPMLRFVLLLTAGCLLAYRYARYTLR